MVIVDWKTGRNEGRFSEVQLAGYALYAAEKGWVESPEELRTELAYLAVPRYVRRTVDTRRLEHARRFIEKSAGTMKSLLLDPLANRGRLEDFPMIERPRICRRCNFRKLCFPRADAAVVVDEAGSSRPPPSGRYFFRFFARNAIDAGPGVLGRGLAVAAPGVVGVGEGVAARPRRS